MDKEKAKRNLETILEKIHADTDIAELHEYQKIFKKEVSFFRRSWAAAWLLSYYDKRETPALNTNCSAASRADRSKATRASEKKDFKHPGKYPEGNLPEGNLGLQPRCRFRASRSAEVQDRKNTKPARETERQPLEINLSEEESKRLFISIGKNRKLFPREVITLIMSKTTTPREDIGLIRILDNYSFVQVRDTKAEEIIQALTGVKFRGRTLSVNYAKPKATETEE